MATIAVIDDVEAIQRVLKEILQMAGHDVLTFSDGAPFLERMEVEEIDMVITDLIMPTGGKEIVRALQKKGFRVPVVVMAGNISNVTARSILAMGAYDILEKPVTIPDLLAAVDKWLRPSHDFLEMPSLVGNY